jgi:NDP-sugar pyrophosphorylase family protein
VDEKGRILSFTGGPGKHLAFTGIQVLNSEILAAIPVHVPMSIIDCYVQLISESKKVMAHVVRNQYWRELGSLEGYLQVHQELFNLTQTPLQGLRTGENPIVHESTRFECNSRLEGMVCIGQACELDTDVIIKESVIWDQVKVGAGCSIRNSIIGDGVVVTESLEGVAVGTEGRVKLSPGKE